MLTKATMWLMIMCLTQINAFIPIPGPTFPLPSIPRPRPGPRPRPHPRPRPQKKPKGPINGVKALGFQYDSGAAWAALCKETEHGTVPGKRDSKGKVYYPWGGKEHKCKSFDLVGGKLIHHLMALPDGCQPRGFQTNDKKKYYNAVINGAHGMVPGKASFDLKMAWYGWGGKEHYVRSDFYVIC